MADSVGSEPRKVVQEFALTVQETGYFDSLHFERQAWQRHGENIALKERIGQLELIRRLGITRGNVQVDIQSRVARLLPDDAPEMGKGTEK